ncbi:uncharacterized protein LOC110860801 [Folsomia candida]|uniref:Uncharacterized protein n=1 Tax=Folsomia candida TaxID=158441 RepID=A0A226D796_FOLCA|nr:uncharacterized protein LOC110860801 [Folsomia candida]OXA40146.1 hypothetical protein Fcan01_24890 [Folsomia candida]
MKSILILASLVLVGAAPQLAGLQLPTIPNLTDLTDTITTLSNYLNQLQSDLLILSVQVPTDFGNPLSTTVDRLGFTTSSLFNSTSVGTPMASMIAAIKDEISSLQAQVRDLTA